MFNRAIAKKKICYALNHRYLKTGEEVFLHRKELLAGDNEEVSCSWLVLHERGVVEFQYSHIDGVLMQTVSKDPLAPMVCQPSVICLGISALNLILQHKYHLTL